MHRSESETEAEAGGGESGGEYPGGHLQPEPGRAVTRGETGEKEEGQGVVEKTSSLTLGYIQPTRLLMNRGKNPKGTKTLNLKKKPSPSDLTIITDSYIANATTFPHARRID